MVETAKKKCFVIAPIGEEGSQARTHSDEVLDFIINPVLESLGFAKAERADHIGKPGIITTQILERIFEDDLVIADLSWHNPNVFYELAIRHGSGKPFIQMIKGDDKIPFDVGQQRTIKFDLNLRGADKARIELKKQVEVCLGDGFQMETPLGHMFDLRKLAASGNGTERSLALLHEKLDGLANSQTLGFPSGSMGTRTSIRPFRPAFDANTVFDVSPFDGVQEDQSNAGAELLLRALLPGYSSEKVREFIRNVTTLGEGFQTWVDSIQTQVQTDHLVKTAKALGITTEPNGDVSKKGSEG